MPRRKRPKFINRLCRGGCGTLIAGLDRPIISSQATYRKYAGFCDACMTEATKNEMVHAQAADMLGGRSGR